MRSLAEINAARLRLADRLNNERLDEAQECLLTGILNGLVWVAEGAGCEMTKLAISNKPLLAAPASERTE